MAHYYNLNSKLICNKNESLSKVLTLLKITKGYPLIVINSDKTIGLIWLLNNIKYENLFVNNLSIVLLFLSLIKIIFLLDLKGFFNSYITTKRVICIAILYLICIFLDFKYL